jgi:hypothetical protein
MTEELNKNIQENSVLLFKCDEANPLNTIFDSKGFHLSTEAQNKYDRIKNIPHLYVDFTKGKQGFYYVGKSFQKGGRWKRQHAYHMGTLAYHLLESIRYDDQNHSHWIDNWMDVNSKQIIDLPFSILLKEPVFITFIPFEEYSTQKLTELSKTEIKEIQSNAETELIRYFNRKGFILLNVLNNRKPATNKSIAASVAGRCKLRH